MINLSSLVQNMEIAIPMAQVISLLVIGIFFVMFGKFKTALIVNFTFIFYWICKSYHFSQEMFQTGKILSLVNNYTVIISALLLGLAVLIFYEISE